MWDILTKRREFDKSEMNFREFQLSRQGVAKQEDLKLNLIRRLCNGDIERPEKCKM